MANAAKDQNHVTSKIAVLNTDTVQGQHLVTIKMDAAFPNSIKTNTTDTISFTMVPIDPHDENWKKVWLFEGSDSLTYPAVANADGELLIDSI